MPWSWKQAKKILSLLYKRKGPNSENMDAKKEIKGKPLAEIINQVDF